MTVRRQYAGRFFCCGCAAGLGVLQLRCRLGVIAAFSGRLEVMGYWLWVRGVAAYAAGQVLWGVLLCLRSLRSK